MASDFVYYNNSYYRNDGSNLVPVTDPDTLKQLKSDMLPHSVEPKTRSLSFAGSDPMSTQGSSNPASTSLKAPTDIKSALTERLTKLITGYSGAKDTSELEARRQKLLRESMTAPAYSPEGEKYLGGEAKLSLIKQRGTQYEPELKSLEEQIAKARSGDTESMTTLSKLTSLAKDLGMFGGEAKAADTKEIDGQLVERQADGSWKVVFGTKKASAASEKAAEAAASAQEKAQTALEAARRLQKKITAGKGTYALGKSQWLTAGKIPSGTEAADLVADFDQLKGMLSLDAMKYLKGTGALSDADMKLLQGSASNLSRSLSEEEFKTTLTGIIGKLETALGTTTETAPQTKVVNGVTYVKAPGGWKKQ